MFSLNANVLTERYIDEHVIEKTTKKIINKSALTSSVVTRGVKQTAAFWTKEDGNTEDFVNFCEQNICKNKEAKEALFYRICDNLETIFGHNNRVTIDLLLPSHVPGYETTAVDEIFGAYDGLSHFTDDMFANKLAFLVILNFPHFNLE
jgi:hypothetical protein